jgi:hypothetical protein
MILSSIDRDKLNPIHFAGYKVFVSVGEDFIYEHLKLLLGVAYLPFQ